jgi:hypothetical protein
MVKSVIGSLRALQVGAASRHVELAGLRQPAPGQQVNFIRLFFAHIFALYSFKRIKTIILYS